jgi:mitochondrial import inner membrane translocase subunit TIM50
MFCNDAAGCGCCVLIIRGCKHAVQGNEHVRDLSKLNRDLSRTLFIVGESRAHTVLQQENVLVIPDWKGMDPSDRTLLDILPLLEILSKQDVLDVRVVCQSYKGTDVVQEFRSRLEAAASKAAQAAQPTRTRFGF